MTEIERLLSEGFITEDFLKEEVRCEYRIPAEMKKVWAIQLDLMKKLFEVCKKHNLRIWVAAGTLIGAVRHKGFIPWDDDADVFLPREDYDKLLQLDPKEFPEPYFLQSEFTDANNNFFTTVARLRNSRTFVDEKVCDRNKITWNSGIFIDIFPLDGIPKSKLITFLRFKHLKLLTVLHHAYTIDVNQLWPIRLCRKILKMPFIHYNTYNAIQRIHRIAKKTKYDNADKVGFIVITPYSIARTSFKRNDWNGAIWMPFENIKVPAPEGFDNILRTGYGDYMKFPPVEDRGKWHTYEFDPDTPYDQKVKSIQQVK